MRKGKWCFRMLALMAMVFSLAFGASHAQAALKTVTLPVSGTINYTEVTKALALINKERTSLGLNTLQFDSVLQKCAEQRAAEIVLYGTHYDPAGTSSAAPVLTLNKLCGKTVFSGSDIGTSLGENIGFCQTSASAVYKTWYNSPGHHAALINSNYKYCGIAMLRYNDVNYWIYVASSKKLGKTVTLKGSKKYSTNVTLAQKYMQAVEKGAYHYGMGTSTAQIYLKDMGQNDIALYYKVPARYITPVKNMSGKVFKYLARGKIKIIGVGKGKATVSIAGSKALTVTATVGAQSALAYTDKNGTKHQYTCKILKKTYTYTGKTIKPVIEVYDWYGKKMKEGVDYKVKTTDSIGPSMVVTASIYGINNYAADNLCIGRVTYTIEESTAKTASGKKSPTYADRNLQLLTQKVQKLSDKQEAGTSTYTALGLSVSGVKSNQITLKWNRRLGASKYIIYGSKCGKTYKKLAETTKQTYTQKKLTRGTYYKFIVVAVGYNNSELAISKSVHAATKGGTVGNISKVTVNRTSVSLKRGQTCQLKVKAVKDSGKTVRTHRKLSYESSNDLIAKVDKNGKITAVGNGTCYIYVYAQNGRSQKVKVTSKAAGSSGWLGSWGLFSWSWFSLG